MTGHIPWALARLRETMQPLECEHVDVIDVGSSHGTTFFRCSSCHAVLVVQRDHVYVIRSQAAA